MKGVRTLPIPLQGGAEGKQGVQSFVSCLTLADGKCIMLKDIEIIVNFVNYDAL